MEVEAGNENMKFETGPFSFYGVMALNAPTLGESKKLLFCSLLLCSPLVIINAVLIIRLRLNWCLQCNVSGLIAPTAT